MPSPVAIAGFVVSRNTCPAPPVASSVRVGVDRARCSPSRSTNVAPAHAPSRVDSDSRQRVVEHADARMRRDPLPQHAADLAAGGVARVQHAAHAVRGLAAERRAARRRRDRRPRPSRSARARSAALRGRARRRPRRRTARRRRPSCRARAAPASRRRRSPRRCRPARSRCCSRADRPW